MSLKRDPESISRILSDALEESGLSDSILLYEVQKVWDANFDKLLTHHCQLIGLRSGILTIKTSNSVWKKELEIRKNEILEKINKLLIKKEVKTINVV